MEMPDTRHFPVIPALGRLRQEDSEFQASLRYIGRSKFKQKKKKKEGRKEGEGKRREKGKKGREEKGREKKSLAQGT
jgi:hypothetical protein